MRCAVKKSSAYIHDRNLSLKGTITGFIVFALLAALLVLAVNGISAKADEQGYILVRDSLLKACVTCYSAEGSYPESLEYIEENYNVHIDRDAYLVSYELTADNLMPAITVSKKGG